MPSVMDVIKIFKKFDRQQKLGVNFSDFFFGLEDLNSGFDRKVSLDIFSYLDTDHDGVLTLNNFKQLFKVSGSTRLEKESKADMVIVDEQQS